MSIDVTQSLLQLTPREYQMLLDGLKELKTEGFVGDLMSGMLETMLVDKKKMSPEHLAEYEQKERQRQAEKARKEEERMRRNKDIDLLLAKLTLLREMKERAEAEPELLENSSSEQEV